MAVTSAPAALAVAVVCVASTAGPQQAPPTFRARAEIVSVTVSVRDGRHPVTGLNATDFEVFDNGVRQEVDSVAFDSVPIDVTLALTGYRADAATDHLQGLLGAADFRSLLRHDDRLRVVIIGDTVRGRLVGPDFKVPTSHETFTQIPGISVIDGLFYALAWPVEPDRRHLIAAFTDGWDSYSTLRAAELPALASRSDAVLHVVFWSSPDGYRALTPQGSVGIGTDVTLGPPRMATGRLREWEETHRATRTAAERTGGTIRAASAGANPFRSILDDFRSSYVLRYMPRGVDSAGWHELKVRVMRPGSDTIRARKGYERR